MKKKYIDFAVKKAVELLAIDSPTGFTKNAAEWVKREFEALGVPARLTEKGGVLATLERAETFPKKAKKAPADEGALLLEAHCDTLGGMVAEIKANGRLRLTNLGGMRAENGETENVRVYTRGGDVCEGTFQLMNASLHVNTKYADTKRDFDTCEVVLDEDVRSKDDVKKLGINTGDIVCFEPRTRLTKSGYIKSRFLDDKLSVGILLGFAKYVVEEKAALARKVYLHVTVFEETGHG
ncbi:MAG: peptidase M42, partial [Firmicutes bacterium]|nr:peptidase M42 [Bacillota bacterium]